MIDLVCCTIKSLLRKTKRTLLTALSIAIGVCSVISISSLGGSGIGLINSEIGHLGLEGLVLTADSKLTEYRLDEQSCAAIACLDRVESAAGVAFETGRIRMRGLVSNAVVWGVGQNYANVMSLPLVHGRYLSNSECTEGAALCMLDLESAREFYHRGNIVGKTLSLELNGQRTDLEIVGIVEAVGGSGLQSLLGEYIPSFLYVPSTVLQNLSGKPGYSQISIKASGESALDDRTIVAVAEMTSGVAGVFAVEDLSAQNQRLNRLLEQVSLTLSLIGSVSLVVAGVGTMTIMLAAVKERTREIGIKKAVGASNGRIMAEFLTESVFVCCIGTALGSVLALLLVKTAGWLLPIGPLEIKGVGMAAAVCILLGAVFGLLPAAQAARLDPIEALRSES